MVIEQLAAANQEPLQLLSVLSQHGWRSASERQKTDECWPEADTFQIKDGTRYNKRLTSGEMPS